MKDFFKDYMHIFAVAFIGLLFGVSFYYLLINAFHSTSISKQVFVNMNDVYYEGYQENIKGIKNNLDKYTYEEGKYDYNITEMQKIYSSISTCYNFLKEDKTIIGNTHATKIGYYEVYELNNYFINTLMDKCMTNNLTWLINDEKVLKTSFSKKIENYVLVTDILTNNATYVKDELRDNSSYYYNTAISNSMVRNNLNSSYRLILRNYDDFSKIIYDLSDYLVRGKSND